MLPTKIVELVELAMSGQWQKARSAHERLLLVHAAMFHVPSPTPAKVVLSDRGVMSDAVRLPMVRATVREREQILAAVRDYEAR